MSILCYFLPADESCTRFATHTVFTQRVLTTGNAIDNATYNVAGLLTRNASY